jgi:serine/threonine protein kinase
MIEWLNYSKMTEDQEKIALNRVNGLCKLLETSKPGDLRVLRSKGYIEDVVAHRYGILFDISTAIGLVDSIASVTEKIITLNQLMPPLDQNEPVSDTLRWTIGFRPTLSERFDLARRLARSFLELHKARWLHKGFNSSKVFFIAGHGATSIDLRDPHIGGFDYSRPTGINNESLPLCLVPGAEIYMHPEIRSNLLQTGKYVKYRPSHDLYSLGVVLLEIGTWSRIKAFNKPNFSISDFHQKLVLIARRNLPHLMGARFEAVVQYCLVSGLQVSTENRPDQDYSEDNARELSELLYEVVRPLEDCQCRHFEYHD